jgi:Tfp pilus assembly protein PilX
MHKLNTSRRESGVVLVIVLMVVMVMAIFATSILSQNMSQSTSAAAQVKKIKARQLAKGAFWKVYGDLNAGVANPTVQPEPMNGTTYTVTINQPQPGTFTSQVTYP